MEEAAQVQEDAEDLKHLGYAQELFRNMGGFSNFALSFSIISIITGITGQYGYGLSMAGPSEMAYGWPLVAFFTLFVALSMAEIASGFPTSGAMYHWAVRLGGTGWGWFTAWFNIVGLVTLIAVVDYQCAQFLAPLIGIPGTPVKTYLLFVVILLSHGLINHVGIRLVSWLNDVSVTVQIAGVVIIVGALLMWAHQQPVAFFVQRTAPPGHSWLYGFVLGLLLAQWTFTGYDASAQVSEETVDPHLRVPWGMVMSVVISSVFGYILLFALTLAIGDVSAVLSAKAADGSAIQPVQAILQNSLGSVWGARVAILPPLAMWFCGLGSVTALSRTLYAFARDDGMPGSHHWRRVSPRFGTPSRSIWLVVLVAAVLLIWSATSDAAADATPALVGSISVIAMYLAYIAPVFLNWHNRRTGKLVLRGSWNLGSYSGIINSVAILWTAFITVVLAIPFDYMAGKAMGVTTILLIIWFLVSERTRFQGPDWVRGSE